MIDDFDTGLFGNSVYPSLEDCIIQLKSDYDLVLINKHKLTPSLQRSLNDAFYKSDVICHELFPNLHSLEVKSFNDLANSRFN